MKAPEPTDILSVTTTLGGLEDARRLARLLVERRLAACVQIEPGLLSLYSWEGQLCEETEVRLTLKTLPGCEAALQALFGQHHPYSLPQFVVARLQASAAYRAWVASGVTLPDG